jgi:uncharacterized protein (DUF983 family)
MPNTPQTIPLPATVWTAIRRGVTGKCPRCAASHFFPKFLKPVDRCAACHQDWTHQRADDFPAYLSILLTGHLLVPFVAILINTAQLTIGQLATTMIALSMIFMLALLQPCKGAVIALQYWHRMHGFQRERLE